MRKWLRTLREEKALSQAKVAQLAGITQQSYQAIEAGATVPRPPTAKRISTVLGFIWTRFYEEDENDEQVGAGG